MNKDAADHNRSVAQILKALVITPNEKTTDLGCLLAIARSEACRREHISVNPIVRALVFVAEVGVYVAVYQVMDHPENRIPKNNKEK
jgi:hypothetical protein